MTIIEQCSEREILINGSNTQYSTSNRTNQLCLSKDSRQSEQKSSFKSSSFSTYTTYCLNETSKFFGTHTQSDGILDVEEWQKRRFRLLKRLCSIDDEKVAEELNKAHFNTSKTCNAKPPQFENSNESSSRTHSSQQQPADRNQSGGGQSSMLSLCSNKKSVSWKDEHQVVSRSDEKYSPNRASNENERVELIDPECKEKKKKDQNKYGCFFIKLPACKWLQNLILFNKLKPKNATKPQVIQQLDDKKIDYSPFFTYWITFVQIIIMFFTIYFYGVGTDFAHGLGVIERSGNVMAPYLSFVRIVVWEQNNVWIGPRFADLVHAGAKFSPCMRSDRRIYEQILKERREEAQTTGCCIRSEGCYQSSECPKQFANLHKWSNFSVSKPIRVVCGLDPRYCIEPKSVHPFKWNNSNIEKWPICKVNRKTSQHLNNAHMHCEVTGRPCCIQMHGQCRITSKEYCDFVRGYYHENASLCSQVVCIKDVCGMTPFLRSDTPDQIYRLITPLFLHAGIIRCLITIILQLTIMRQFENMIGWVRLSLIYFISGIGGYLASSIFVPYMPEVGPAGSQGGVLGALIINVIYNWDYLRNPRKVLIYHLSIAALLFLTGFLPYVDNWAQLFGFIFGILLSAALLPYFNFGKQTKQIRILIVIGGLASTWILFILLFAIFYINPESFQYDFLSLFNCPFEGKVCDQQGLILRNWLPI